MALYKNRFMTGDWSRKEYNKIIILGLISGWMLYFIKYYFIIYIDLITPSAVFIALAYISLIIKWNKSDKFSGLQMRIRTVGLTALSNYLLQTIISVIIFYDIFLNFWQYELDMFQMLGVVIFMWILQIFISHRWLAKFQFGPFEWIWRSLYYWKRQSLYRKVTD